MCPSLAPVCSDLSGCYFWLLSYLTNVLFLKHANSHVEMNIFTSQSPQLTLHPVSWQNWECLANCTSDHPTLHYGTAVSPELHLSLQSPTGSLLMGAKAASSCCHSFSAQAISIQPIAKENEGANEDTWTDLVVIVSCWTNHQTIKVVRWINRVFCLILRSEGIICAW